MTLYKATAEGNVPMSPQEEAEFEASRAAYNNPNDALLRQIKDIESQFSATLQMRAFTGDAAAAATIQSMLQQIDTLKAQLV